VLRTVANSSIIVASDRASIAFIVDMEDRHAASSVRLGIGPRNGVHDARSQVVLGGGLLDTLGESLLQLHNVDRKIGPDGQEEDGDSGVLADDDPGAVGGIDRILHHP